MKHLTALVLMVTLLATGCARPASPPADLAGSAWTATAIQGQAVAGGVASTLVFLKDQRASGNAGCNAWSGPVVTDAGGLRFGPVITTRKLCQTAVNTQEQRFLAALDQVRQVRMEGQTLRLLDGRGAEAVTLIRTNP